MNTILDAKPTSLKVTSKGKRLAAYLIDNLILVFPASIMLFFIGDILAGGGGDNNSTLIKIIIVVLLSYVLYNAIFELFWQQTPGKMIMGTKVFNKDGSAPTQNQIFGRNFARLIPLDNISYLFSNGFHDMAAGTAVFDIR